MNCLICTKPDAKLVRLTFGPPNPGLWICDQCRNRWRDKYDTETIEVESWLDTPVEVAGGKARESAASTGV